MSEHSKIEWTDSTWNPIRGCSRVSEGCRNCYAEHFAARFSGPGQPYEGLAVMKDGEAHWTGEVRLIEKHLEDPLHWKKPRKIFVNSMSDLFHEKVDAADIARIFLVMQAAPQHVFQVLTKRPQRMKQFLTSDCVGIPIGPKQELKLPLPNIWLGVSVEDQETADKRIPLLLQTPAAVRWISYEPALGPLDLRRLKDGTLDAMDGIDFERIDGGLTPYLDWVVCGGESGPGARPMHPDWARSVRDQCQAAGVPFFFKQWGEWIRSDLLTPQVMTNQERETRTFRKTQYDKSSGYSFVLIGKGRAGRLLDGREWNEYPKGDHQ